MIVLSIAMTEGCNLNCTYCNVNKQSKLSIDPQLFLQTFYEVRAKNPSERIQVDFYGGEPLLYFNKIKFILENLKDDNVQFFMPTNGLLLTEERLNVLNQYNVDISLSFDGLWQDINRPQGQVGHNKNTQHIYESKKGFFTSIPNFKIHAMIYPGNYNILENHLYLTEYGANPQFTFIEDIGVWSNETVDQLKVGIDELFDWYMSDTNKEMPDLIRHYLLNVLLYKSKKYTTPYCGAGDTHLSFSENKLVACNRFKNEPDIEAKIPEYINMAPCQTCEVQNYCSKGCMYENIKNGGPIVEVCDIFKHMYNRINTMVYELRNDLNFKELVRKELYAEYGY